MISEKNILALTESLERLGFTRLEQGLRLPVYLGATHFTLLHQEERNGDKLRASLYFIRREDGAYACTHYDVTLRPRIMVNGHGEATSLEKQMQAIAWERVGDPGDDDPEAVPWAQIQTVVEQMEELSHSEKGSEVVGLLQLKYWSDTKLEGFIPHLSALKLQHETTQRFHYFTEEEGITLNEAYRFLSHRWRQRLLTRNRKMPLPESSRDAKSASDKPNKKREKGTRNKTE